MNEWLNWLMSQIAQMFPTGSWMASSFNVKAMIVVVLVSVICGAVGSLVVGNRMAFFSDALAHCAFAGITLGLITALAAGLPPESFVVPLIMVSFGVMIGLAIALVRERTGLANDTVIGVFFAFAIGFGGMLFGALRFRSMNPESFLFGSPLFVQAPDILALLILAAVLFLVLWRRYNDFVLVSFNPSLARSRQIPLRWCSYLFIVLLAMLVNLCITAVGALLINAMLVVPAATAANFGRNLRHMFWGSVLFSLASGISGLWVSNTVHWELPNGATLEFGPAGTIVVISVLLFFASVVWKGWIDRPPRPGASLAADGAPTENAMNAGEPEPSPPS
jgi:zinc transport system permease protein